MLINFTILHLLDLCVCVGICFMDWSGDMLSQFEIIMLFMDSTEWLRCTPVIRLMDKIDTVDGIFHYAYTVMQILGLLLSDCWWIVEYRCGTSREM